MRARSHLQLATVEHDSAAHATERIGVVLGDDHSFVRHGLRQLLESETDIEILAEAEDLGALDDSIGRHQPRVVVLDMQMPGRTSTDNVCELRERAPATQVVVLTVEDSPAFAQRALAAGALGFVTKDLADRELADAIRAAARGEQYVSPRIAARLDALNRSLTSDRLTSRETEVLQLISLGHTSVEIARRLSLSPRTVETHRAHIHRKLGLGTRAELVRFALRRGLLAM